MLNYSCAIHHALLFNLRLLFDIVVHHNTDSFMFSYYRTYVNTDNLITHVLCAAIIECI